MPSPQGSYQPSPSPQSYHQVAPSPVGYQNTHSPASYHPTPSPMAYQVPPDPFFPVPRSPPLLLTLSFLCPQASPSPSPVGYSPMTPGAPSPGGYNPHTPGSGIEQSSSDWVTTDIQVKVRDTYLDSQAVGQTGVIRSVTVRRRRCFFVVGGVGGGQRGAFADPVLSAQGGMCSVYLKDSEKVVSISSEHLEPVTPTKSNKVRCPLPSCRLEASSVPLVPLLGSLCPLQLLAPHKLSQGPLITSQPPSAASGDPTSLHKDFCGISEALPPSPKTHRVPHADLTPSRLVPLGFLCLP